MARFIYSPLKSAQKEIRLISLLPGLFDSDIKVEIFYEKLSEQYQPDYEALSYVWGSTEDPEILSIAYRNQHGDRTSPGSVGVVWIDAICINQDDIQERSLEVARMGFIYNKARQVIVWLGPHTENSELAIETLR
ncbi:HET-domain-containing protein [Hyaloscypha variabilis F]|uniref:HET-domain-containing protein n=1 Tax=Hyaloscypha variabilis (strain UAMH 11265 / GT02V1 / F) TaxID=1149755 RepID=A0A2J6R1T8_HYAVF|nr:HET-domain-containing protein [Hyaloscypha variabilis F]